MMSSEEVGQEKTVEGAQESCCCYCQWKIVEEHSVKQDEQQQTALQQWQTGFAR
jgi:hypothetical protein